MLIVFSGLPGTGKTTTAQALARQIGAVYLRIDVIEQAIREAGVLATDVGASGYGVANALALSNLSLGHTVVADCVNPVEESREAWKAIASTMGVELINIEVVCSDPQEHRRRVETRTGDIPGLVPPTWQSVSAHEYEPWDKTPLTIDTSRLTVAESVSTILADLDLAFDTPK
ncbi:AAA family ATPase [Pseudomonas trivialis]|uniref:Kinase n=1 Tax=Pseudomonas trivialis TaxID=200450 RepID=A0A0H5AEJ9_9PSED|nr:AAA family ATPase [Pseudomonas trivialis]AKS09506.1 kinase [Pseudomonas trivialis]